MARATRLAPAASTAAAAPVAAAPVASPRSAPVAVPGPIEPADSTIPTLPPTPVDLLPPLHDDATVPVQAYRDPLLPDEAASDSAGAPLEDEVAQPIVSIHRQVQLARTWRRALAAVLDLVAVALLTAIYLAVALQRLPDTIGPARGTGFDRLIDATLVYKDATLPAGVVLLILMVLYQTVFVTLLGQTPGLVLMRCYVLSTRGRELGAATALFRALVAALGLLLLGVGWSLILVDTKHRTLHDRLAGTLVGTAIDEAVTLPPEPAIDAV